MLAYLFWHRPAPRADPSAYELALRRFHESMRDAPAAGLVASACHRLDRIPWLAGLGSADGSDQPGYEDWYLLRDSAALDTLNAAAVDARHRSFHDAAAALAGDGTAGLYSHVSSAGGRTPERPEDDGSESVWLSKPTGVPYSEFMPSLIGSVPRGACVWQRQLVLGPAPEFCIELSGSVRVELPGTSVVTIRRSIIA